MEIDIYDKDVFELHSFHLLERDEEENMFRWTEGIFKITPKKEVKNICLKFACLGGDKKIVIFIENEVKNLKKEYSLQNNSEYILTISVLKNDKVSFFVTPSVKTDNGDFRNLALLVKKIFLSS
jgi:hypothetical protein